MKCHSLFETHKCVLVLFTKCINMHSDNGKRDGKTINMCVCVVVSDTNQYLPNSFGTFTYREYMVANLHKLCINWKRYTPNINVTTQCISIRSICPLYLAVFRTMTPLSFVIVQRSVGRPVDRVLYRHFLAAGSN